MSKTWAILTREASTAVLRECGYEKEEAMSEQEALARTIQDNMRDKSGCFVGWQTCYAAAEAVLALRASGHGAGREAVELLLQALELPHRDQYDLAFKLAENIGYFLAEPSREANVRQYVDNYQFEFDGGGSYVPTESERAMLEDAIEGFRASGHGAGREALIAERAREWAADYPQGSDGRNTFVCFAEWIEGLTPAALERTAGRGIPDFGKHRVKLNSGGYETELECDYIAPLLTFDDLMLIFDRAEAEAKPEDRLRGDPSKWPNHRGVYAVVQIVLKAIYEFQPPAAPSPDDQPAGCESAARSARIAIDKV